MSGPAGLERRRALIIGNDRYPTAPLANASNDARSVAEVLAETGFETMLVENGTLQELERAIARFVERVQENEVALVFYAGHGFQIDGENYLVPIDFKSDDPASAKFSSYPANRLIDSLAARGPKLQVFILDACRNNPFRVSRNVGGGLAMMGAGGKGTFIALATAPGSTASDNPNGSNGLFTSALLKVVRKKALGLTEIFDEVKREVSLASNDAQRPWTNSDFGGKWYFLPPDDYIPEEIDPALSLRILEQARGSQRQGFGEDAARYYDQLLLRERESELGNLAKVEATFLRALYKVRPNMEAAPTPESLESVWNLLPSRAILGMEAASAYLVASDAQKGIGILSRLRGADKDIAFKSTEMLQELAKVFPSAAKALSSSFQALPPDPMVATAHSRFEGMAQKLLAEAALKARPATPEPLPAGVKSSLPPPTIQGWVVRLETIPEDGPRPTEADPTPVVPLAGKPGDITVTLKTVPEGAKITVEDTVSQTCTTPCALKLAPGRHPATLTLASFRTEAKIMMVTKTDTEFNFDLTRKSGQLLIDSVPDKAYIEVDGKIIEEKTPAKLALPPANYLLSYWDGQIRVSQRKITLQDNEIVRLKLLTN